jgi:Flp pilus assembly protein CpaB
MHVDVLSTEAAGGLNGPSAVTRTILQNIRVFSTDAPADKNPKDRVLGAQSVNLLVTPEQAETLSQAIAQNRIQLALRNPLDDSNISDVLTRAFKPPVPAASKAKIPWDATERPGKPAQPTAAAAAEPAKPSPPTVEIVQGTKRTVMVVAPADNGAGQSVTQGLTQ